MADIAVQKKDQPGTSTITRPQWDPFRSMRDLLRWDPFQEMAPLLSTPGQTFAPAFDVKETKDSFVFKADVPGIKEQDLEIDVAGNRLTISGKREEEKEDKNETFYTYERSYGSFCRAFTLPIQADTAHVKAEIKNGELTVLVPKTAAAVAKRIPVASGDKPKA